VHHQFTLHLELLTPAFVGSAEPRRLDPYMPLRPSSVRGMLRSWFRAAAAALMWPADTSRAANERMVKELRQVEEHLFGSTERASAVVVSPSSGGGLKADRVPDPAQWPGLRYLGYGLFEDPHRPPEALITGEGRQNLTLSIGLRRQLTGAEELLHATVWLWLVFGGIGARNRRGFGSLHLADHDGFHAPSERLRAAATHQDLIQQLLAGLDWVMAVFREWLPRLTSYPLETGPGPHSEVRTLDGIGTLSVLPGDAPRGLDALDRAGRLFRDFRSTLQRRQLGLPPLPDYFAVKASLEGRHPPSSVDRAAFGLPLPFYFRSLQGAQTRFVPQRGDRLSSPLCFRVHALEGGAGGRRHVVTLFNLAEANGALPLLGSKLVQQGTGSVVEAPDGKLIQRFIDWAVEQAARSPEARGRRP
jgi:CRISPR-associated protein Cmr1